MRRSSRRPLRPLLALVAILTTVGTIGAPASADEPIVPDVRLEVDPEDRAPAGTEIDLIATVNTGLMGSVVFLDGGVPVATAELVVDEDVIYAAATYTPTTPGVHELTAWYEGTPPDVSPATSPITTYSVLPATCPDQAVPGAGALVRHAYLTILGRCPDPAGFSYWSQRLAGGGTPAAMARALALSAEGIGATVDAAYRQLLDRSADAAGRAVWAAKLRSGWTTSQLWAALAVSPEFVAGAPGDDRTTALVERAFARIVGRPVDEGSATYWYGRLFSGAPRSATLRALSLTPEALGHTVRAIYQDVLGRTASPAEQASAQATIKARRGDWRLLAAELLGRPEASTYAQRYPDPVIDD
ncbi:MAG TPA: DUF4214 domain-containing protein [Iamia sp.]